MDNYNQHYSPETDQAKQMTDQVTGLGKEAGRHTGRVVGNVAKQAGKKMAKKAIQAGAKAVAKVGVALGKAIVSAFLYLLPYILILLAIVLLCLAIWYAVFEVRGSNQDYAFETDAEIMQQQKQDQRGGGLFGFFKDKPDKATEHDKQVKAFYQYFGTKRSYYQIVGDDNTKLITPDDENAVKDYYNKEQMYTINPNFLFVLDEFVYKRKFRFPEQFVEPVHYDPVELKLKPLTDETGKLIAKSTTYDKDGKKTDKQELGVWDYGFASVFKYKKDELVRTVEGTYYAKDVFDTSKEEVVQVPINEPFNFVMDGYPVEIDLMTHAITFAGDYVFEYEKQKFKIHDITMKGNKESKENEPVNRIYYETYHHYVEECSSSTDPETGETTESCWMVYKGSYDLYKHREGAVYETRPVEVQKVEEEPNTEEEKKKKEEEEKKKEEERLRYLNDYLYYFKSYIPESVMTSFDFKERVGEDFLTAVNFDVGGSADLSNGNYARAMQYYGYAQKWGSVYQVEPEVIIAIIAQESGGRADVEDGLMQITGDGKKCTGTPSTGPSVCVYSEGDRRNPDKAIQWGVAHFREKLDKYGGDYLKAIQSHNLDPQYIFDKYPQSANSTEWLQYREEMRLYYGQKEGYGLTKSASYDCIPGFDTSSVAGRTTYGDVCYLEHVLRYYSGNAIQKLDGEAGESLGEKIGEKVSNVVSGILNFFGIEPKNYLEDEPRFSYTHKITSKEVEWFITAMRTFDEQILFSEVGESSFIAFWDSEFDNATGGGKLSKEQFLDLFGEVDTVPPLAIKNPRVSTYFGVANDGVHSKPHGGIDLAVPKGTPIFAVSNARVVEAVSTENGTGWGYYIKLQFKDNPNMYVLYAHLSKVLVKVGDEVEMGEHIGYTGGVPGEPGAGRSTGPHLHFELYNGSQRVDPIHIALQPDKFL